MSSALKDYPAVRDYLYSLKHHGAKYGIDRMRLLAERLGHPEASFPIIHVAGTNGKGSTCAMLESIFRASGYKTGLYTSPHLVRQGERIQINRQILGEKEIINYTKSLRHIAESLAAIDPDDHPSFFEFMTAMAFLHFASEKVDIGILETGLGGRLDATNIVRPQVCAITSISLDHTAQLGNTYAEIAREKAGIIKAGVPVVMGHLPVEAEEVIRERAASLNCRLVSVREIWGDNLKSYPNTNLEGSYQRINAAVAWEVSSLLETHFPQLALHRVDALMRVDWDGRWQRLQIAGRQLILDSSHNIEGAIALRENLERLKQEGVNSPIILAGTLGEERAEALIKVVSEFAGEIHLLSPNQSRACSIEQLRNHIPADYAGKIVEGNLKKIFPKPGTCSLGEPGDTIVATGSIYLLGEIMEKLTLAFPAGEEILQDCP